MSSREIAPARDAATIVVLRNDPGAKESAYQIFMVRRHDKSGFMAGAYVFPGGRLDDADRSAALAARCRGLSADDAAARLHEDEPQRALALFIAAARETFEEAGVLLAKPRGGGTLDLDLDPLRDALNDGSLAFETLLADHDLELTMHDLWPQARWVTPVVESRRYDTRFFLARAPEGQVARHDAIEVTAGEWLSPRDALQREREGTLSLPPPTLRTLEHLSTLPTIDAVFADARSRTPPIIQPVFHDDDGAMTLALPGDPLHPIETPAFPGSTRLVLERGRWWSRTS